MTDQLPLLDPSRLAPAECPVCHATRQPNEHKAPACSYERDRDTGSLTTGRRPRACLNAYDPTTADIGF